jgi:NADH-quinone oxidoreductase subunit L
MNYLYTIWIPLVPLLVFLFTGLLGSRFKPVVSGIIGTTGLFVSFLLLLK